MSGYTGSPDFSLPQSVYSFSSWRSPGHSQSGNGGHWLAAQDPDIPQERQQSGSLDDLQARTSDLTRKGWSGLEDHGFSVVLAAEKTKL